MTLQTSHLMPLLQGLVDEAIRFTCGQEHLKWINVKSSSVHPAPDKAFLKRGDFETKCAYNIFKQLCQQQAALFIKTLSAYGVEKVYRSPIEFAEAIVDNMNEEKRTTTLAHIHINSKGTIVFTTTLHLEWHLISGRLPCTICGSFLKSKRGLRMHLQVEHGVDQETATVDAHACNTQLIVYTASKETLMQWEQDSYNPGDISFLDDPGIEASRTGDLSRLQDIVQSGWDPHTIDRNGSNAISWAAGGGNLEVCKYLHETCGVSVNTLAGKAKRKRHILHWAARNGHIDVCAWLVLEKEVPVDIPTEDGTVSLLTPLLTRHYRHLLLSFSTPSFHLQFISQTALHYATMTGQFECCRWLIEVACCDINRCNSFGCNASQWIAMQGDVLLAQYLRDSGLDILLINHNGHSVLHKSAMKGHMAIVQWFIRHGGLGLEHMQV